MAKLQKIIIRNDDNWFTRLPGFPPGKEIYFDPHITWVVGENGSGKSSLLQFLSGKDILNHQPALINNQIPFEVILDKKEEVAVYHLDTETMNPRIQTGFQNMYQTVSRITRRSHGQTLMPLIQAVAKEGRFSGAVALIDEPESGISPWNQKALIETFRQAAYNNNVQLIIVTHSVIFAESRLGSVIDLNNPDGVLTPSSDYTMFY